MNNVDFVFMNRTFPCVGALADATFDDPLNKFTEDELDKNFYFKELGGNEYWRS